tara:strand:+ start:356 stop:460 length:105 start_codon:yes stop_codon:yes gene_type:complete
MARKKSAPKKSKKGMAILISVCPPKKKPAKRKKK